MATKNNKATNKQNETDKIQVCLRSDKIVQPRLATPNFVYDNTRSYSHDIGYAFSMTPKPTL